MVVEKFLNEKNYNLPIYTINDTNSWPMLDKNIIFPTTYLISPQGKVVLKHTQAANWASQNVVDLLEKLHQYE